MTYCDAISAALAALRRQADLDKTDLANRLGVDRSWISKLEKGEGNPTAETVDRYLVATDTGLNELIAVLAEEGALRDVQGQD